MGNSYSDELQQREEKMREQVSSDLIKMSWFSKIEELKQNIEGTVREF